MSKDINAQLIQIEAFEILKALFEVCDLEDFIYEIRADEGLGWNGPRVIKYDNAVERARELINRKGN